ncbi:MAG: 16S rRNA (guanine(966)-N(2))-methyltransferase RsmD [Bdellovibrionaceae bacterium]|nr:16S rRNA (guanine(966)-N(2))-methyltransferase RsmD [Pseudobdellovibrionaceae bacterium]
MRIIAGRFRGRQLVSFSAGHIRPTTDRVKESIFNKLQNDVLDGRVLDLFSGTGNLAIEALSRGAAAVTAVELNKKSLMIIRENMQKLGIQNEIQVVGDDVLKYIRRYKGDPFDVILIDPPFTEKMADVVLQTISQAMSQAISKAGSSAVSDGSEILAPEGVIMIESSKHEIVQDEYPALERFDHRDYGDKLVSYFRRKGG